MFNRIRLYHGCKIMASNFNNRQILKNFLQTVKSKYKLDNLYIITLNNCNCSVPEQLHASRCTQIAINLEFLLKHVKTPRGIVTSK